MQWLEVYPIPEKCRNCAEEDCYNCDTAGLRWRLSKDDELRTSRILKVQAIERLQKQVAAIDMELLPFTPEQRAGLKGQVVMTYDLFWECLQVCFNAGNMDMYMKIWRDYPEHVRTVLEHRKSK